MFRDPLTEKIMIRTCLWMVGLLVLSGCNRLDTLLYVPRQTGKDWLHNQPFLAFEFASKKFILVQPSSTVIVYFLGVLTIAVGVYFIRNKKIISLESGGGWHCSFGALERFLLEPVIKPSAMK